MGQTLTNELTVALGAARQAAMLCRAVQRDIGAEAIEKKDRSPVTVADFGSQAVVCRALAEAFADDPVIAEEGSAALCEEQNADRLAQVIDHVRAFVPGASRDEVTGWIDHGSAQSHSDRFWTVDPIDGTKGFLRNEQYAVSLALIVNGQIELGVLACPNLAVDPTRSAPVGVLLHATRRGGAYAAPLDEPDARPARVQVSTTDHPADARFCESVESGHSSHADSEAIASQLSITRPPLRRDSQAKYATVARGEADIYLRLPTSTGYREKIWDHAGGVAIVTEAGGRVTDITGRSLDFTHGPKLEANRGVIATNGRLHDAVLAAVGSVLDE
jgi:3'(2'), 5'-bisphosphate nucleotidase